MRLTAYVLAAVATLGMAPGKAGAAECSGVAPAISTCRMTFTASGGGVGSESQLLMDGQVDAVATSPSGGRIEIHCRSSLLGSESCSHSLSGPFRAGETVTLVASAAGTGYWRVAASA